MGAAQSVDEPADDERPCANPQCRVVMVWRQGRGRPGRFCSRKCRECTAAEYARLVELLETERALVATAASPWKARSNSSAVARLSWVLSAYPAVTDDEE